MNRGILRGKCFIPNFKQSSKLQTSYEIRREGSERSPSSNMSSLVDSQTIRRFEPLRELTAGAMTGPKRSVLCATRFAHDVSSKLSLTWYSDCPKMLARFRCVRSPPTRPEGACMCQKLASHSLPVADEQVFNCSRRSLNTCSLQSDRKSKMKTVSVPFSCTPESHIRRCRRISRSLLYR